MARRSSPSTNESWRPNAGEAGRATKRYLNESVSLGFEESFALYMELQRAVFAGADFAEAKRAFAAKRDPVWR